MFNLIRRISGSVLPRTWSDDAASNTPQIGRKRRRSEDEREDTPLSKKPKGVEDTVPEEEDGALSRGDSPAVVATPGNEEAEVKEVTEGVKEVGLDGKEKVVDSEASLSKEKNASPPLETQVEERQKRKKQVEQKVPGSPMKDVKSTDAVASAVNKDGPIPSSELSAAVASKPRAKKSNTAPAKKALGPASPPRKKKPLPTRKSAAPKATPIPSDADAPNEKSNAVVTPLPSKGDDAV